MMNWIWLVLIGTSVIAGICTGTIGEVQDNLFSFADTAVELALGLIGVMTFFCGLMKIMEEAGLCEKLGHAISPVMKHLFPGVPKDHPANSAIAMYVAASVLGLGNACTPLGIKAMQELQTLNKTENIATDAQCMVMAISTGSITLIPTTIIAMRTAVQAEGAAEIVGPTILSTMCAALVCIILTKLLGRLKCFNYNQIIEKEKAAGTLRINKNYVGNDPIDLTEVPKKEADEVCQ